MSDEATIGLAMEVGAGQFSGQLTLPLRVRVQGIEAVLVSAAAYDALASAANRSVGVRSRIERDPDVQQFVDERLGMLELPTLLAALMQQFGENRAPSLSGLHRYAMARRKAAEAVTSSGKGRRGPRGPR